MRRSIAAWLLCLLSFAASGAGASEESTQERRVPLEFGPRGHLVVPARINGHEVFLVVDTGASATVIDSGVARSLGLSTDAQGATTDMGAGSAGIQVLSSPGNRFVLAGTVDDNFLLRILDLGHVVRALSHEGRPIAGVVGKDWLMRHGAVIDYARRSLHVTWPNGQNGDGGN